VVRRAKGPLLNGAIERLIESSGRTGPRAVRDFLSAARRHGISIDNMWCSISETGQPDGDAVTKTAAPPKARQTCLAVPGDGETLLFFTSAAKEGAIEELARVIETACRAGKSGMLAQTLLDPSEDNALEAFRGAGFQSVGMLEYLSRSRPTRAEAASWVCEGGVLGDDVRMVQAPSDDHDAQLMDALERTYMDTLDCPELCGLRKTVDVVASHRSTGKHDPKMWWLIEHEGRALGAILLNPNPEQSAVELVYMGIAPELRGKGFARKALHHAMSFCAARDELAITCAVDTRNAPARALYEKDGFVRMHTRLALVRAGS